MAQACNPSALEEAAERLEGQCHPSLHSKPKPGVFNIVANKEKERERETQK